MAENTEIVYIESIISIMIARHAHVSQCRDLLDELPVVAIIGARQIGKTTLAKQITAERTDCHWFDLEDPAHLARLVEPQVVLEPLRGLVVIDEIQRLPDLFPLLRVLVDRPGLPARFLVQIGRAHV